MPYSDYIIGTRSGVVKGESGLGALVDDVSGMLYFHTPCGNAMFVVQDYETDTNHRRSILTVPFSSMFTIMNTTLHVRLRLYHEGDGVGKVH